MQPLLVKITEHLLVQNFLPPKKGRPASSTFFLLIEIPNRTFIVVCSLVCRATVRIYKNTKIYDKRDNFNFDIVNFPFLDSDVPGRPSYGVYISQQIALPEHLRMLLISITVTNS